MCRAGFRCVRAHRHIARDDGDFGLEVDAPCFVGVHDVVARSQHGVGRPLVHQRIGPEFRAASPRRARGARARRDSRTRSRRPIGTRAAAAPSRAAARTASASGSRPASSSGRDRGERGRRGAPVVERRLAACARSREPRRNARGRARRRRARRRACRRDASRASSRGSPMTRAASARSHRPGLPSPIRCRRSRRAAGRPRPSSSPCAPPTARRQAHAPHRGSPRPSAPTSTSASPNTRSNASSVARFTAGGRSPRSASHATASARGTLRSSLMSFAKRSSSAASGSAAPASRSAWKPLRIRSSAIAAASSASQVKLSWPAVMGGEAEIAKRERIVAALDQRSRRAGTRRADFAILASFCSRKYPCIQKLASRVPTRASVCAISFVWWTGMWSSPPQWMSK